uniref:Putative g-protein coupled receptor mth2 n=1 Tax=Culex tarsalis TaxID=7177 RepID=A0A1Q3FLM5_CULTA
MTNLLKCSLSASLGLVVAVLGFAISAECLSQPQQQLPCEFRDSVNISGGTVDAQGNIHHDGITYEPRNYALISYDYEGFDNRVEVPVAYPRGCICRLRSCVRLCCPAGQWLASDGNTSACVDSDGQRPFKVRVNVSSANGDVRSVNLLEEPKFGVVHQKPCAGMFPELLDEWSIDETGSLQFMGESIPQNEYCLNVEGGSSSEPDLFFCPITHEAATVTMKIGIIISIPFLLATLLIYACLPELRNIHGKSLICYVFSLTCTYLVILHLNMNWDLIPCEIVGYLFYFWVLVSFFWLNVMCFDIFWTFSSGVVIKNERKRFWYYSLYAWGSAMTLTAMLLIIEKTNLLPETIRPNIGIHRCFINSDKMIEFVYFYLIILLLVVLNVYFFVVTAVRIIRIQRATDAVLKQDSRRHSKFEKDRYRFSLYLRLFVVMGITWTFELISWAIGENGYLFYVTDVCNCLLGVIIFFLFVWKKKVRQLALKRIGAQHALSRAKSTTLNTTSSTCTANAATASREGAIPLYRSTSDSQGAM